MSAFSCLLIGNEHLTVECGKRLLGAGHRISAVVTRREDIADWARSAGLDVLGSLRALADSGSEERVDWLFSIANLDMIPDAILERARSGAINFHDGPLPRYAGLNAPVWAILNGESRHGITWHVMQSGVDTGDIVVSRDLPIAEDETAFTLNAKCFAAGIESFDAVLEEIARGLPGRVAQDLGQRSYFGLNHRPAGAGRLDFQTASETLLRLVRALNHGGYDNPVATPFFMSASGPVLVGLAEAASGAGTPGTVLSVDDGALTVALADGAVRLSGLADPMGNPVEACDAARAGEILASPSGEDVAALDAAISAAARKDRHWRRRFKDFRPADWPMQTASVVETTIVPVAVPVGIDEAALATAFGVVISAAANHEAVDLALALDGVHSPVISGWVPIRIDPDLSWSEALDGYRAESAAATEAGAFAADLPARIADLHARHLPRAAISSHGKLKGAALTLILDDAGVRIEADGARISPDGARLVAARLEHVLASLDELPPQTRLRQMPVLPDSERQTVIETFNRTVSSYPADLCVHSAFELQASASPDAIALVFEGGSLTYTQLNARSNRLANVLIGLGVGPGHPVGLHMHRTAGLVVAALAILKAGGAYVPLDPGYPADRISFYASDSGARVIVSEKALDGTLAPEGVERVLSDADPRIAAASDTNPETAVSGHDLAYLIYTSGSTGTPKGVMIEHRNVANFFTGMDSRIPHDGDPVFLSVTSLSFDISVLELFWTLSRGFKVVLLGEEKLVSGGTESVRVPGGMDFSLFYWGNDDGVGRDKYGLLLEGARFADENGFQAVWTPERHFHAFGGLYPNPSVTGAAVAAITRNLAVRAGSVVAPLHHPARIAEEWAVIDNLTNGRTGLAIASGWHPDDFVLRPENAPPNNKAAVFDAIRDLRKLWAGEPLAMTRADGTVIEKVTQPRPVSKELEMWLTIAGNPDAWRQAGEAGVHVLTHLLGQSIKDVEDKIRIYHEALRTSGRNPEDYKVTLMLHTYLAEDRETAMDVAREPMKAYLKAAADLIKQYAWAFPAFKKPAGVETPRDLDLGSLTEDEMEDILEFAFLRYFETSGLFGTVEDALDRVAYLKSIGVTEVACLVDYGIERQTILDGLTLLADVRARSNVVSDQQDFSIAAQIARHGVTHLQCTPYMARMMVENETSRAALGKLKYMMIGGEALPSSLVSDLRAATEAKIENMYGPTETTIWSSTGPATDAEATVSVGKPIANTQFYVLGDDMVPCGIGQVGQLWIGGAGVARGYWERPDLTADKFRENPFHGGRMFGTGDLARWRADGALDFLGRRDNQIKIRGYRIEIGEIEAAMEAIPGITQAVAVVRQDASGVGQIYGYVTGSASESEMRAALGARLPVFMVPTRIVTLDRFPLTPNRKIDRGALPDPTSVRASTAPAKQMARQARPVAAEAGSAATVSINDVAAIWSKVLNVQDVQPSDNFFDLGGHSLLAIEVHRQLKSGLGVSGLSIADIFRAPTLGGLTGIIQKLGARTEAPSRASVVEPPRRPETETVGAAEQVRADGNEPAVVNKRRLLRASRINDV